MSDDDWGAAMTQRVGDEVKRLRGRRSGQWLSDRTAELGQRVSRSTISEIETGRRKSITVSDLILLAAALDTTPVALVFPGPYRDVVRVMPDLNVPQLWGAQWFSGLLRTVSDAPFTDDGSLVQAPRPEDYSNNMRRLRQARTIWKLAERKSALWRELQRVRSQAIPDDKRVGELVDAIADLELRIDEIGGDDGR